MTEPTSTLLICTVGGTPEPVVAALKHWQPKRVCFVHTPQTKNDVEGKILPKARDEGVDLDAGRYHLLALSDGQDLARCVDELRPLTPQVTEWAGRGDGFRVVVDFTGGTKCMSAAIGLQASRWPCLFSYVGGGERTKEGVGVVVSGTERVVYQANPWDALGYQAVEDFIVLFDQRAFRAAAQLVKRAKSHVDRPDRKRELAALKHLARAFDAWDRFDHKKANNKLKNVTKMANDLRAALGQQKADCVLAEIGKLNGHLTQLLEATPPSRHHVVDLLANAKRRKDEGRIDDAVARLYRAIEAMAQVACKERHSIDSTEQVPLDRLPETLRAEWASRATEGTVRLGLQDAYRFLAALGDPLGEKFERLGLQGMSSPLLTRNRSILAHGFVCVSDKDFNKLWRAALSLADIEEASLPSFPILGG